MALEAQLYSQNLGFSQNCIMNTTNNLSPLPGFDFQPPPQQQQQQRLVQGIGIGTGMGIEMGFGQGLGINGIQGFSSSPCSSSSNATGGNLSPQSLSLSQSVTALLQKQRRDLDQYIHFQGDKLRQVLQQQRMQELALLINTFESRAMALMKEKDEDLEKLRAKTKILEDCLKRAEQETEAWQRVAREKEEIVIGLNNMIEQVKASLCSSVPPPNHESTDDDNNDAESVCDCDCEPLKNRGDAGEERENGLNCICRWCNCRSSRVVFLPCKHLCCCKSCDALLRLCPVCHTVKQGSIEIFLS